MWWLQLLFALFLLQVYAVDENNTDNDVFNSELESWPKCDPDYLEGYYTIAHTEYCDRYFTCQNSIAYLMQCQDGFGYTPFLGCRLLHRVDCKGRSKLQRARGNEKCPRLYGLFNDPRGCGRYFKCVNGTAIEDRCPDLMMYDDELKDCRKGTVEELSECLHPPSLIGCTLPASGQTVGACTWFQCPILDVLPFVDHSRHAYPGYCSYYIKCLKDGKVLIGSCEQETFFNPNTGVCESEMDIKLCSITTKPVMQTPYMPVKQNTNITAVPLNNLQLLTSIK